MSIGERMQAVIATEPGGPEVLETVERPAPRPEAGEVLVEVRAAGINRPDVMQRQGRYPVPDGVTDVLGLEVAGTIAAIGPGITHWRVGDPVCALVPGGGYAQFCIADADQCLPVPVGLDLTQAAALPEACFTVWHNLVDRGHLRSGESVLVHGGASGIGTMAIQMACHLGARVFATAGSDERAHRCKELGAEAAFNYRQQDFETESARLTDGQGVNVVLDMVGGSYAARNLRALAVEGRLLQIAFLQGSAIEADVGLLVPRRLTWSGSTLRPRPAAEKAAIARALKHSVWPLIAEGAIRPVIDRCLPFAEVREAHRVMDAGGHFGKLVLEMGDAATPSARANS
ncbi:MAG: NAD(P)H-quinone oxidoreductase [Spiribacter salinus]|uniref:NAD(P)H-quinone oxidoreductase n=1 Tax=Spiribacter salinus TaxID=1335746 RepID=A0A540VRG3_9GAMM|nr:MAG: NAD(P)H-quinone oxidoreductase [Spiribacter salinus]